MHFSTIEFWMFFTAVWAGYILSGSRGRPLLLLVASYLFYASWGVELLGFLWVTTLASYVAGYFAGEPHRPWVRRLALWTSVGFHVGVLFFFRYLSSFLQGFATWAPVPVSTLSHMTETTLIPVGISFFTLQCMSYPFERYNGKVPNVPGPVAYGLFVAFFPQLLAGPIERAFRLLPQIFACRRVHAEDVRIGAERIVLGLWQKLFIADTLSHPVNAVYSASDPTGPQIYLATAAFAVQLYGDFAGYSNMARGAARLLGFELSLNFDRPFLATNPADFWRRWHITLYEWLRDYVYFPLIRSEPSRARKIFGWFLAFFLVGLWHGSGWNFPVMGAYLGMLRASYGAWLLFGPGGVRVPTSPWQVGIRRFWSFQAFLPAMLAFRADDLSHLERLYEGLTRGWSHWGGTGDLFAYVLPVVVPLMVFEWLQERHANGFRLPVPATVRYSLSVLGLATALLWSRGSAMPFIYFIF